MMNHMKISNSKSEEDKVKDLLPCPFCNNTPYFGSLGDGRLNIKCYECGVVMIHDRYDKLKYFWNRRKDEI